jgi:hypothetical protein
MSKPTTDAEAYPTYFTYLAERFTERSGTPITPDQVVQIFQATSPAFRAGEMYPVIETYWFERMEHEHLDRVIDLRSGPTMGDMTFEPMQGDAPTTRYLDPGTQETDQSTHTT